MPVRPECHAELARKAARVPRARTRRARPVHARLRRRHSRDRHPSQLQRTHHELALHSPLEEHPSSTEEREATVPGTSSLPDPSTPTPSTPPRYHPGALFRAVLYAGRSPCLVVGHVLTRNTHHSVRHAVLESTTRNITANTPGDAHHPPPSIARDSPEVFGRCRCAARAVTGSLFAHSLTGTPDGALHIPNARPQRL